MELTQGEIAYLMQLVKQDITDDIHQGTPADETVGRKDIYTKLKAMYDETKPKQRLLQKLDRIALEHRQMLEIIAQERQFILE